MSGEAILNWFGRWKMYVCFGTLYRRLAWGKANWIGSVREKEEESGQEQEESSDNLWIVRRTTAGR